MSGRKSYDNGLSAEARIAAHYQRSGRPIAAQRWRGTSGEIDLVARDGAAMIFIEVKQADSFDIAAERLSDRQKGRICGAASEFIASEPMGQDTEVRFDLALVDRIGRFTVLENAFGM